MQKGCFVYITEVDLSRSSGAGTNEREFVRALRSVYNDEVICVVPYPQFPEHFFDAGLEYVFGHRGSPLLYPAHLMAAIIRVLQISKHHKIRAIVTRMGILPVVPWLLARVLDLPLILKRLSWMEPDETWSVIRKVLFFVLGFVHIAFVRKAIAIDVETKAHIDVIHWHTGVAREKIVVIPNGTNTHLMCVTDQEECRLELGLDRFEKIIGYVGALQKKRCIDALIQSISLLKSQGILENLGCVIVGDGSERDTLEKLCRSEGLVDQVVFIGSVPYEMVPKYVGTFDVAVDLMAAPMIIDNSIIEAAYSQKIAQYLACGRPVLAWNIIGTEFLEENDIGSLAKLHNVDDLAERIRAMFCLTRTSQDDMFKRTRKYAEEYLSYLALNERRMSFWRQVMSETSEPSTFEK